MSEMIDCKDFSWNGITEQHVTLNVNYRMINGGGRAVWVLYMEETSWKIIGEVR